MKKLFYLFVISLFVCLYASSSDIVISDNGEGIGTQTWTKNNTYYLDGTCFVNNGQELTIEAGTVIKARVGEKYNVGALIIGRGGKIYAMGTQEEPIIMTIIEDPLDGNFYPELQGSWGGITILGNAKLNNGSVEVFSAFPSTDERVVYGGNDDDDFSGELRYVSIRYTGAIAFNDEEYNGLFLGAVGRQTVINNIELIYPGDDGLECIGGTVNCKNIIVYKPGDDAFDFDKGYTGSIQFALGVGGQNTDKIIESDNDKYQPELEPITNPKLHNFTIINENQLALCRLRRGSSAIIKNSIFIGGSYGIQIEYNESLSPNSFEYWENGLTEIKNNIFYNIGSGLESERINLYGSDDAGKQDLLNDYFSNNENLVNNPGIVLNPLNPKPQNEVQNVNYDGASDFIEPVDFQGAFSPDFNWASGWSFLFSGEVSQTTSTPVFNYASGTYYNNIEIEISSASQDAVIYYTTDGTIPSETNGTKYTGSFSVSSSIQIKSRAFKDGLIPSSIAEVRYNIDNSSVADPNFEIVESTVGLAVVSISCETPDAEIYFSIDGNEPTIVTDNLYSSPITLTDTTVIKAFAIKTGLNQSNTVSTKFFINDNAPDKPEICIISVDLETGKNMVVWNKQGYTNVSEFIVWRETNITNFYKPIDTVPFSSPAVSVDLEAVPEQQQYLYKVSAKDANGIESAKSLWHKTLFLVYNGSPGLGNLIWFDYEIEDDSDPGFVSYIIYRGDDSSGIQPIDTVSTSISAYVDQDDESRYSRKYYRLSGLKASLCDPTQTKASSGPFSQSISNIEDNRLRDDAVEKNFIETYKVNTFPNPVKDNLKLEFYTANKKDTKIALVGIKGDLIANVFEGESFRGKNLIDINLNKYKLSSGVYYLKISIDKDTFFKRVVKE